MILTQPLSLDPSIRHLGPDDELSAASITNVTRQLADRDFALSEKLNELIAALRSALIVVPVVLPRVILPALSTEIVGNFRIPANYLVTVLNAAVASTPTAGQVVFEVIHSAGTYGQNGTNVGATSLLSTTGDYAVVGEELPAGELIFKLESSATTPQAVSASVLLMLKPQVSLAQLLAV